MDLEKLQELIRIFEASDLNEIEIEEEGRRMRLQKAAPPPPAPITYSLPVQPPGQIQASTSNAEALDAPVEAAEADEELPTIDAPMVGTFYAAPAPGEAPFVEVGKQVEENQTVCIIEAMKLMNEVSAKFAGTIERVLVENGQPVEFGQPLFVVRPL